MGAVPCVSHYSGAQHTLDRTDVSTVSILWISALLWPWTRALVLKLQFVQEYQQGFRS